MMNSLQVLLPLWAQFFICGAGEKMQPQFSEKYHKFMPPTKTVTGLYDTQHGHANEKGYIVICIIGAKNKYKHLMFIFILVSHVHSYYG